MNPPLTLDQNDAMTIMMVVSESLMAIQVETLTPEAAAGVCLLFDRIMSRIDPLLPQDDRMEHVYKLLKTVRETANKYCLMRGLPTRQ